MEIEEQELERVNIDYFLRKQEFINSHKPKNEFIIMYKTYYGSPPSIEEINNYQEESSGIINNEEDEVWDEDELF